MRTLHYDESFEKDGQTWTYAINMRWSVQNEHGVTIYRGPEWRARAVAEGSSLSFGEAWTAAGGKMSELVR